MGKIEYNGIINVLKPAGMTSFDVVGYLRKKLKIKKVGHTGTLDPMAMGVLPVCIGSATKLLEILIDKEKSYRVEMKLGESTDTQDSDGVVIEKRPIENITKADICRELNYFLGKYDQIPPMYSAIKINGKKLYELARKGIEIDRKSRSIFIKGIEVIDIRDNFVKFDVQCSKGTYIRTLCHDVGERLGCCAHMTFLLRTKSGNFKLEDSKTIDEINQAIENDKLDSLIYRNEDCFVDQYKIVLNSLDEKKFKNGGFINCDIENYNMNGKKIPVFNFENLLIGLGEKVVRDNKIFVKPSRLI